jgi:hypothetical protein
MFADCLGLLRYLRRYPLWEWHFATCVATRWCVLLSDFGQLLRRETAREPNQRRPEPTMNQGDLAIDEPTHKDLLRLGDRSKDCVDVMALRMCPPTALDWFAGDGLGEAWSGSLG